MNNMFSKEEEKTAYTRKKLYENETKNSSDIGLDMDEQEMNGLYGMAETEAERDLEAIPQDQRATDIDALVLRRYMISEYQFRRAILFVRHQRREMRDNLVNQRHRLIEQLTHRSSNQR